MKRTMILLCILLTACLSYAGRHVGGNGKVVKQECSVSSFVGIEAGHVFRLIITQADKCSVTIETDENLMELVTVNVSGGTLNLGLKGNVKNHSAMNAYVSLPRLNSLRLSSIANAEFTTDMNTNDRLKISLSGASSLDRTNFHSSDADIHLSGASSLTADFTANKLNAEIAGASSFLSKIKAQEVRLENSGASRSSIDVAATGTVRISVSGVSGVTGKVTADNLRAETSGSSSLKLSGRWGHQKLSASGTSNLNVNEAESIDTDVSASGSAKVSAGRTSITGISKSGASSISTNGTPSKQPKPSNSDLKDFAAALNKLSADLSKMKISSDTISRKLHQVAAEFAELAMELSHKAENATISINGKNYLLKDIKISVVNNSDGSVSLFMNGEEVYRLNK